MRPLLVFLFLLLAAGKAVATDGLAIYNALQASIVTVTCRSAVRSEEGRAGIYETSGAGVILDAAGTIATNTHIIYGSRIIEVTLPAQGTFPATVLFVSPQNDFSIIRITPPGPLTPVTWADSDLARLQDEVVTIGHSPLLKSTISGGNIKSIGIRKNDPAQTPEFFELNINHYEGDSGGPVFDREGRLLGLMNAKRLTRDRSCLVVPANKIHFAYLNVATGFQKR
jgi:serine protease Do